MLGIFSFGDRALTLRRAVWQRGRCAGEHHPPQLLAREKEGSFYVPVNVKGGSVLSPLKRFVNPLTAASSRLLDGGMFCRLLGWTRVWAGPSRFGKSRRRGQHPSSVRLQRKESCPSPGPEPARPASSERSPRTPAPGTLRAPQQHGRSFPSLPQPHRGAFPADRGACSSRIVVTFPGFFLKISQTSSTGPKWKRNLEAGAAAAPGRAVPSAALRADTMRPSVRPSVRPSSRPLSFTGASRLTVPVYERGDAS